MKTWRIALAFLVASIGMLYGGAVLSFDRDANAATTILDGTSCPAYGGVWDAGTSTCTISSAGNAVAAGDELVVPSGVTLVINNPPRTTGLPVLGTVTNNGTITVSNSDFFSSGISINGSGTLTNNAAIAISSGGNGIGCSSGGSLTNNGSITASNVGQNGINVGGGGTVTNNGAITVSNSGGNGIGIVTTVTNNGTITVSNTGGIGINNGGTLTNNSGGHVTVSNTNGVGIESLFSLTNDGAITVSNAGGTGIYIALGALTNDSGGQITVSNTGNILNTSAITNNSGGQITNSGTITNDSGGQITNSGTITNDCGGVISGTIVGNQPIDSCGGGNTPVGGNVPVDLGGGTSVAGGISLTFSDVTTAGDTTLALPGQCPTLPAGFSLGTPPACYDLTTTAAYDPPVEVCINYSNISFGSGPIALLHYEGGLWPDVTTSVDTANQIVCGDVSSLSPFVVAEAVVAPPSIVKAFGAAAIELFDGTSLTFTLNNANATALTGIGFTDTLPTGLIVSTPNGLTGLCGGAVTAMPTSSSIALTDGTLAAGASCTVSVKVIGTTVGLKTNTTDNVTSTEGGSGSTASANLTVRSPAGRPNCHGKLISALAKRFGGIPRAATALGFATVRDLQQGVRAACRP